MKEVIEIDTGLSSGESMAVIRIYARDLVILAKALDGKEYLDVCVTDGIRRIANIDMFSLGDFSNGLTERRTGSQ